MKPKPELCADCGHESNNHYGGVYCMEENCICAPCAICGKNLCLSNIGLSTKYACSKYCVTEFNK